MSIVIIPCAIFATRIYPLTKEFPKPLLNVAKDSVYALRLKASWLDVSIETYQVTDCYLRNSPLRRW